MTVNEENDVYPSESKDVVVAHMEDIENSPAAIRGQEERMVINAAKIIAPESPVVSRLKDLIGLRTAKSFNSCFGNRIERIGSWSGLGCNNVKTGIFEGNYLSGMPLKKRTNKHKNVVSCQCVCKKSIHWG